MKFYKNFLLPVGLLSGTVIGAGAFALPYFFKSAGLGTGFFYLTLGAFVYCLVHLLYADIIVRTPGEHRFVGYTKIYFGEGVGFLAVLMTILEMIFVMTIYLVLSASFSNLIIAMGASLNKVLTFWVLGSVAIFLSVRKMTLVEFLISWGMIGIIALIFVFGLFGWEKVSQLGFNFNYSQIFLPLAPVLFALGGRVAIPSLVKYFHLPGVGHQTKLIKKAIIVGTIIPAVCYGLFVLGILGLSGSVSSDAVSGLVDNIPGFLLIVVGILGILALWSSYIVVGLDVSNSLKYDFKIPDILRLFVVVMGPVLLYFAGFQNFITLVSFVGGIFLALEGILIIMIWNKARKVRLNNHQLIKKVDPAFIALAVLIFLIALVNELVKQFT